MVTNVNNMYSRPAFVSYAIDAFEIYRKRNIFFDHVCEARHIVKIQGIYTYVLPWFDFTISCAMTDLPDCSTLASLLNSKYQLSAHFSIYLLFLNRYKDLSSFHKQWIVTQPVATVPRRGTSSPPLPRSFCHSFQPSWSVAAWEACWPGSPCACNRRRTPPPWPSPSGSCRPPSGSTGPPPSQTAPSSHCPPCRSDRRS